MLLADVLALRAHGSTMPLGHTQASGRAATELDVVGTTDSHVLRVRIWPADDALLPLRVDSFAANEILIETVDMIDAQANVRFSERFFSFLAAR